MLGVWSGVHGAVPAEAGERNIARGPGRCLVLGRYYLGLPFYRLEGYQAMLGVPVADATQWDQIERVADCGYVVFEHLETLAAQGELIYQDDTRVRILSLIAENQRAGARGGQGSSQSADPRDVHHGLVVQAGERTICLYYCGSCPCGGEPGGAVDQREADRDKPLVMSDALAEQCRG